MAYCTIKTEEDYTLVLSRLEELMKSTSTRDEERELELLLILTARYEAEHYPMTFTDPDDAIRFMIKECA